MHSLLLILHANSFLYSVFISAWSVKIRKRGAEERWQEKGKNWGENKEKVKGREKKTYRKGLKSRSQCQKYQVNSRNILVCGKVLKQHIGWALSKLAFYSRSYIYIFFNLPALIIFLYFYGLYLHNTLCTFHNEIKGIKVHTFFI